MYEPWQESEPTWQSVKGTLIHRCVLACAGKWLSGWEALRNKRKTKESHFVDEARWMAQHVDRALRTDDGPMAWALLDSGGPRWTGPYAEFRLFPDHHDQILDDLEHLTVITARDLMRRAKKEDWLYLRSECSDPFAFVSAETKKERSAANSRMDLLVTRRNAPPLIVDLKFGEGPFTGIKIEEEVEEIRHWYGSEAAAVLNRPVGCSVLTVTFDGDIRWSEEVTATAHATGSGAPDPN